MSEVALHTPDRLDELELPDGRVLGTARWGDAGDRPVLFVSGAGMGCSMGFADPDHLRARGLELIAVERPGIGTSTFDPMRDHASWTADVRALLTALGVDRAPVVAFSQGLPFASALAHAGLASELSLVSGQDDLHDQRAAGAALPPPVLEMLDAVVADPVGFEGVYGSIATAATLLDLVTSTSSPFDLEVFTQPAFRAGYEACLVEGFGRGAQGYARDLRLSLAPWPFRVEEIGVPVTLWYGRHDRSPVHSPDLGRRLAERFPAADRRVIDEAGGSILWTHARSIVDALQVPRG